MTEVTKILSQIEDGEPDAAEKLLPLVYAELRKLAANKLASEKPGQTLQATALVHEAFIRLVASDGNLRWNGRGHFFGAAAEAMRRILIDRARDKKRLKRNGKKRRIDLSVIEIALDTPSEELLALNEALERLTAEYPDCGEIVKLKFFAGLSLSESASLLGIPRRSIDRKWAFARAWLHRNLKEFH